MTLQATCNREIAELTDGMVREILEKCKEGMDLVWVARRPRDGRCERSSLQQERVQATVHLCVVSDS